MIYNNEKNSIMYATYSLYMKIALYNICNIPFIQESLYNVSMLYTAILLKSLYNVSYDLHTLNSTCNIYIL